MKKKIHPEYKETTIVCACGEVIHTKSTKQNIRIDICSKCHPFFTGQQKLIDSAGMVEKFKKKYEGKTRAAKKKNEKAQAPAKAQEPPVAKEAAPENEGTAPQAETKEGQGQ